MCPVTSLDVLTCSYRKKKCMKQLKLQNPQIQDKVQSSQLEGLNRLLNTDVVEAEPKEVTKEADKIEITSGSPLPGVKLNISLPQELDDVIMIPKETIDILKDQVFGFNTFFIILARSHMRLGCCLKETCEDQLLRVTKRSKNGCRLV
ncbi:hypothetical protein Hanom_Chr15g01348721 [Helianthus anomalus]